MCGLCGIVGPKLGGAEWDVFKQLLIVSTLRGEDGAGVVATPMKGGKDSEIFKVEGCAAALATSAEFLHTRKGLWSCLMGHARAPTSGNFAGLEDVHPHISGPIIGMHNGTMTHVNGTKVGKNDSDSRLLFNAIRNQGIENTLKNSDGAYALSYMNKSTDQLCFIRNNERPLYFMQIAGLPFLTWASEKGFLDLVVNRTPGLADKATSIYRLPPDYYLTFRIHNTGPVKWVDYRKLDLDEPTVKATVEQMTTPEKSTEMWETKKGSYLTEDELKIALATGCANCSRGYDIHDFKKGLTLWHDKTEFMCYDCAENDPLAREYLVAHGVTPPHILVTRH